MMNQQSVQELYLRIGNSNAFADYWFAKRWVCWDGQKIPYQPSTNKHALARASSTDPETWGELPTALATVELHSNQLHGIGVVLNGDGLVCIDLDKCVDNDGNISPEAQRVLDQFPNTYAEYSPSGKGIHIWLRTTQPLPADGKRTGGIELYQSKRYLTVTGNRLANHPDQITDCTQQLHQLYCDLFGTDVDGTGSAADDTEPIELNQQDIQCELTAWAITPECTDDELIQAFCSENENGVLWAGGKLAHHQSESEADCALAYRLLWLTGGDTVRAERLFRLSPRARREKLVKRADDLIPRAIQAAYRYYLAKQPAKRTAHTTHTGGVWNITLVYPSEHPFGTPAYYAELCLSVLGFDVRFWRANKHWMCYDSQQGIWLADEGNTIIDSMIRDVVLTHLRSIAENNPNLAKTATKQIAEIGSREFLPRIRRQMELDRDCWTDGSQFDQQPHLIPLKNGVWDVARGELLPHSPDYYFTRTLNAYYNPDATGINWEQALDNWCWDDDLGMPNSELREYLLHALGYTLTGSVREQKLFIIYGPGSNGKSTLLSTIQKVMDKYSTVITQDVLTVDRFGTREHARLMVSAKNKRFVIQSELAENVELDAERIKLIVSTEAIPMRQLYHESEMVQPTWKLWVSTNHIPPITDQALWRRVIVIPFLSVFDDSMNTLYRKQPQDKNLPSKLEHELDYIATQLCQYATRWFQHGLPQCDTVAQFTSQAQVLADPFEEWFGSCVVASPNNRVLNDDAYNNYSNWVKELDQEPLSKEAWGKRMRKKGVDVRRIQTDGTRKRFCVGIELQP